MSYFSPSKGEKVRFNPVLVRRLNNEFGTAKVIFEAGRDSVFAEWIPRENLKEPLIIILDFSLDVRETLLAISHNIADLHFQSSQWLDGKSLINLDINGNQETFIQV